MIFHPRKLFHPYLGSSDSTMGMGRRTNYSSIPSPLHSPIPLSSIPWVPSLIHGDHMHLNLAPIVIIVLAGTTCIIMFLITLFKILRYYYPNRYNVSRSNPPILFDIRGDFPFSDDEEREQAIRHPIWFILTEGLQQSIIDSITVCKYRKEEGLTKESECLVCLGEFQQEESLRVLPKCNHAFHVPCVDTWLRSHKTCPLCRAPIVLDVASVGGGTESDSSVSDMNECIEESNYSGGEEEDSSEEGRDDGIQVLNESGKVSGHSSILIGSASDDVTAQEFDDEIELKMKRSVSVDSSFPSMVLRDVLDLNLDTESLVIEKVSISSNKDVIALQERNFSLRFSSHDTKFLFSRRSRSQSLTLPL